MEVQSIQWAVSGSRFCCDGEKNAVRGQLKDVVVIQDSCVYVSVCADFDQIEKAC